MLSKSMEALSSQIDLKNTLFTSLTCGWPHAPTSDVKNGCKWCVSKPVRAQETWITLNRPYGAIFLLYHWFCLCFSTSLHLLQLFRRALAALCCCEAPGMFCGQRTFTWLFVTTALDRSVLGFTHFKLLSFHPLYSAFPSWVQEQTGSLRCEQPSLIQ